MRCQILQTAPFVYHSHAHTHIYIYTMQHIWVSTCAAFPSECVHLSWDNKEHCECLPRGVSDSLRTHGYTLIHTEGEIRVKHGRRCHCSLTPEKGTFPYADVTVLSGREQCCEDKQSHRTACKVVEEEEKDRWAGERSGGEMNVGMLPPYAPPFVLWFYTSFIMINITFAIMTFITFTTAFEHY